MKINWKQLIIAVLIPLAVGGISAFITMDSMKSFEIISKPPLTPPAIVFPIVWTVLYILMGISSYLVLQAMDTVNKTLSALFFYGLQLFFNFFWSIIFFNMEAYLFAFIWLVAMIILIAVTVKKFYDISRPAAYLMLPYLAWCLLAAYLNLGVYLLN